ncbi:unnamed protein product [Ambrosiozyma monospora]|uniref:Unnamed protein product n=1 Tax=Ambrosiozyma monospora TaxID=43982 RepID=A0A9W6YP41_AMBMO|nr:unnamed protein product [Ambrosiozyma monospora]
MEFVIDKIQDFLPYRVVGSRLKNIWHVPINRGGFGLLDLQKQIAGRRAMHIYELITPQQQRHPTHNIMSMQLQSVANLISFKESSDRVINTRLSETFQQQQH